MNQESIKNRSSIISDKGERLLEDYDKDSNPSDSKRDSKEVYLEPKQSMPKESLESQPKLQIIRTSECGSMSEKEELKQQYSLPGTTRLAEAQLRKQKTLLEAEKNRKSIMSNKSKHSR